MGRTIFCIIFLGLLAHQSGAASPKGFAHLADGTIVEVRNKTQQQATFKEHDHSWTDPQPFIKKRLN
jgi:hypothetical protein